MRTFAILSLLALASAQNHGGAEEAHRSAQQGECLVSSAEAVSDLMDASMFTWAAMARCGKAGEDVKCEISISSVVQSVTSMINVIVKSLDQCGDLGADPHKECGQSAGVLTKTAAGLSAATGGVIQKCFDTTGAHGSEWAHSDQALCVVNIKNTMKTIFKTIKSFMGLKTNCADSSSKECATNVLNLVSGYAGIGEYLAGTLAQCSDPGQMKGSRCAQESAKIVQQLTKVASASVDMSTKCAPGPAPVVIAAAPARLFEDSHKKKRETKEPFSPNLMLAALLPVTAIVSFVGGRTVARRATVEDARELELE